jgi:hypothetical protein
MAHLGSIVDLPGPNCFPKKDPDIEDNAHLVLQGPGDQSFGTGSHTDSRHSGNPAIRMCSIQRSRLPGAVHIFSHFRRSLLMDSPEAFCR